MMPLTDEQLDERCAAQDPDLLMWRGFTSTGTCSTCERTVDNFDDQHRVTAIGVGGRGVECVVRGDIRPDQAAPLGLSAGRPRL